MLSPSGPPCGAHMMPAILGVRATLAAMQPRHEEPSVARSGAVGRPRGAHTMSSLVGVRPEA